jgi:hypothetical protein
MNGEKREVWSPARRARGLARQATEDRIRGERTLETLRRKERELSAAALRAEGIELGLGVKAPS